MTLKIKEKRILLSLLTGIFVMLLNVTAVSFSTVKTYADDNKRVVLATTSLPKNQGIWYADVANSNTFIASWNSEKLSMTPGTFVAVAVKFTAPCDGTLEHRLTDNYVFAPHDGTLAGRDKTRFSIVIKDKVVFPQTGNWADIPYGESNALNFGTAEQELKAGESMYYVVENGGNNNASYDGAELKANFIWRDSSHTEGVKVSIKENYYFEDESQNVTFGNYKKNKVFNYVKVNDIRELGEKFHVETAKTRVDYKSGKLNYVELNDGYLWGGVYDDAYNYVLNAGIGVGKYNGVMITFTAPCDGVVSNDFGNGWLRYLVDENAPSTIDGIRISVVYDNLSENEVLYPYEGVWKNLPTDGEKMNIVYNDVTLKKGERICYLFDNGGKSNSMWDAAEYNMSFLWKTEAGDFFVDLSTEYYSDAEKDDLISFGNYKKSDVLGYYWIKPFDCVPLGAAETFEGKEISAIEKFELAYLEDGETSHYYLVGDNLLVYETWLQPGFSAAIGIEWTAPSDGRVSVSQTWVKIIDWCAAYFDTPNEYGVYADGVRLRLLKNDSTQLYPLQGEWELCASANKVELSGIPVFNVSQGDKLMLVIDCNQALNWDCLEAHFIVKYAEGNEDFTAFYDSSYNFYDEESAFKYYSIRSVDSVRKLESGESEVKKLEYFSEGGGCLSEINGGSALPSAITLAVLIVTAVAVRKFRKGKGGQNE